LDVYWNDEHFGAANGGAMAFGFDQLIAHAARTRDLVAGTVIGSGTVSNDNYREVGSSCIAERRGIEMLDEGAARTGFMKFGDRVRMETLLPGGRSVFGAIEQRVVKAG
jgi:fumarylacetoacetate (FAA) hydrolase